jgi:Integrase zinc binding domain
LKYCLPEEIETIQDVKAAADAEEVLPQAIQTEELIWEQARDTECKAFAAFAGLDSIFNFNADGLLVRIAPLDKAKQIVVLASLRPRILHLEHSPQTAGHPGSTRMFRSMRRKFFWPNIAQDFAETVRKCATCAKNRIKERACNALFCVPE